MNDRPDSSVRRRARLLGLASIGLGAPALWRPHGVARLTGTDDSAAAPGVIGAVGARELLHAALLLAGPPSMVWTRVAGDALDLAVLESARRSRRGERRRRVALTTAAVLGVTVVDLWTAVAAARSGQHGRGRPGPLHVDASITVNRPVQDVYGFWRDFTNLPTFMGHLQEVRDEGDGVTRWRADAPLRRRVEWRAQMTGDETNRRIAWRSLPGSDIDNAGTVHFQKSPDGGATEVRVSLHYDVPGGAIGRAFAKLLGEEPEQQVRDDLRRFKQVMETGDIVRSDGLPDGSRARNQLVQRPAQPVKHKRSNR